MASLAPVRPPSSASNRSPTSAPQPSHVFRHQHSLSSSTPSGQHFGALSPRYGPPRSAGGPRQSLDNKQSLGNPPVSPRLPPGSAGHPIRPSSEMLGLGAQQQLLGGPSLEAEAIDKWFEDLQTYEATLEEMAAASLDASFKEELSAIEQWFRVLSEAERTAALYSLLQSSTQVQIRFFITVLQQMARSDPMTALLSPAPTGPAVSMKQQMEAKLAQLSKMSPASPIVRQFARQSLGANMNTSSNDPYLSPHSALLNESGGYNGSSSDAAALLASQRAKLQSKAANRVSAPGQLLGDHNSLKSPKWSHFSGTVEEEAHSRSSSPRPKSTSGNEINHTATNVPILSRTLPSPNSSLDNQLSPALGGSWASQVNTPLVPMFGNKDQPHNYHESSTQQSLSDAAANRLAQWGATHQAGSNSASLPASALAPSKPQNSEISLSGIQLDDARKFRRASKSTAATGSNGFSGVLSGMNSNNSSLGGSGQAQARPANTSQPGGQAGILSRTLPSNNNNNMSNPHLAGLSSSSGAALPSPRGTPSLLASQQAAMASSQQSNWRNGLNSPSGQPLNSADPNLANNLAMMNTLAGLNGGMNMNGIANLAAMANIADPNSLQNMANLLNMRQQIQQVQNLQALQQQLQQTGMMAGMMNTAPLLSPVTAGRLGMNMGFPMNAGVGMLGGGNKRAAGAGGPGGRPVNGANKPNHTPGSGANPEEDLDMNLLSDISAWLRGLRLHKYTPNFEGCTWKEMVMMDDGQLEARGVAAIGARRKMLRTFETVRIKTGMALPGDGEGKHDTGDGDHPDESSANQDRVASTQDHQYQSTTTNISVTPESDS